MAYCSISDMCHLCMLLFRFDSEVSSTPVRSSSSFKSSHWGTIHLVVNCLLNEFRVFMFAFLSFLHIIFSFWLVGYDHHLPNSIAATNKVSFSNQIFIFSKSAIIPKLYLLPNPSFLANDRKLLRYERCLQANFEIW